MKIPVDTSVETETTPRWSTKQLTTMALLCSLAILLGFVEFPIFPAAPFLKYDPSFVPIIITGLIYGPAAGLSIGVVEIGIHGLIMGDFPGSAMNLLVVIGFVLPACLIYKKHRSLKGAIVGLVVSVICSVAMAIAGNLVITPFYIGAPVDAVIEMIIPILLPFNAMKAVLNAVLTLIVYKSISNLVTPLKDQVSGRKQKDENK
ncbi:MAG: ECF transporter S component [Eggerthellaceae bacterium]|nr:ECF transporter S component [Eggerthellaceae bacterium]